MADTYELDPAVRIEEILNGDDIKPANRLEYFLKKAATEVPKPTSADAGKVVTVNEDGDGYVLSEGGGGGGVQIIRNLKTKDLPPVPDGWEAYVHDYDIANPEADAPIYFSDGKFDEGIPVVQNSGVSVVLQPAFVKLSSEGHEGVFPCAISDSSEVKRTPALDKGSGTVCYLTGEVLPLDITLSIPFNTCAVNTATLHWVRR